VKRLGLGEATGLVQVEKGSLTLLKFEPFSYDFGFFMICYLNFSQAATVETLKRELALAQEAQRLAQEVAEKFKAKSIFLESLTNSYPDLVYNFLDVERLSPKSELHLNYEQFIKALPQDLSARELATRHVFHTCRPEAAHPIGRDGLRPAQCDLCQGSIEHDRGWFGDHTKGVYVSKNADYTFFYQNHRRPVGGDKGTVLMFQMVTGRIQHLDQRQDGAPPMPGYF
jgi:hypothetical protein